MPKISKNDLDNELQQDIDRSNNVIDSIINTYSSVSAREFLTVSKQGGSYAFTAEKMNTETNKIVLNETDFVTDSDTTVGKDSKHTQTTINDPYILSEGLFNTRMPSTVNVLHPSGKISADAQIYKLKVRGRFAIFYNIAGALKCYDVKANPITKVFEHNIVEQIRVNFVSPNFQVFDVLDICPTGSVVLISTKRDGVFALDPVKGITDKYIPDANNVTTLELLPNKRLLALTNTLSVANVTLYNISGKTPTKIDSFNDLRRDSQQKPISSAVCDDYFAVLGTPLENGYSNQNIHLWKIENPETSSYKNIDTKIFPHSTETEYVAKITQISDGKLYVIGKCTRGMFIWEWDLNHLDHPYAEYIFEYTMANMAEIDRCYISEGIVTFDIDNRILTYSLYNKKILSNYMLDGVKDILWFKVGNGSIVVIDRFKIATYAEPVYTDKPEIGFSARASCAFISTVYVKCDDASSPKVNFESAGAKAINGGARIILISPTEYVIKATCYDLSGGEIKFKITLTGQNKIHFLSNKTTKVYLV